MKSKGQLTKERILDEATKIVIQKGFQATSISDILNATGMKKGSLYFHYSEKNVLIHAILDKVQEDFMRFLDSSISGSSPGEALNNFFDNVLKKHQEAEFIGGCIFGNTALEMGDKCEDISKKIGDVFDKWMQKLTEVIKSAQTSRQIRYDISADMLAHHIVAALEGGIMLSRLNKDEKSLRDCIDSLKLLIQLEK